MKLRLAAGLALAIASGAALAQSAAPPPPPAGGPVMTDDGPDAPPPGGPAGRRLPPPGGPEAMDDGPDGPPPPHPHGHRPPPPPKAAHFHIEHGDMALDIKCADDEPLKACADLALQMIDKLQAPPKP